MKIALVTYAFNVGGMETMLLDFAEELRRRNHKVSFVLTEKIGPWHMRPQAAGFEQHDVLRSRWQSRDRHARRIAGALQGYDVVIFNHSAAAQATIGLLPPSTVTVSILHNNTEAIYRIGLSNFDQLDAVVAVGEQVCRQAAALAPVPGRVVMVRNGVARPVDEENPPRRRHDKPLHVIYVGRLTHEQKGVLHLPEIVSASCRDGRTLRFDIVGDGPDATRLRGGLAAHDAAGRAIIHGALSHDATLALMREADVLLMPSFYEGQPITLFEGMVRGLVPVVSRLHGITDCVVDDDLTGFLIAPGDVEGYVARLIELDRSRETLEYMSAAARDYALCHCTVTAMVDRYLALIEEIVSRPRSIRPRSGVLNTCQLGRFHRFPYFIARNIERLIEK